MLYKFIGYPDRRFRRLEHGKIYDLEITTYWCNKGFMKGEIAPIITSPIRCPYASWKTFNQNWVKV